MRDSLDCVCVCPLKPSYTCCLHSASETNRANKQERWCPLGPAWYFPAVRGKGEREVKGWGPFPVVRLQGCWKTFHPLDLEAKRKWRYHLHVWSLTCTRRLAPPPFPIGANHGVGPLSELSPAEHVAAISLAWCRIAVLLCCWGWWRRDVTCAKEGVAVTCQHASVTVPGVSMAPSGPLSLCLAGNSWLPWKDVWCMLV